MSSLSPLSPLRTNKQKLQNKKENTGIQQQKNPRKAKMTFKISRQNPVRQSNKQKQQQKILAKQEKKEQNVHKDQRYH